MSKTIAIHQPETLPWCGFFYKMMMADEFIILDNVQFKKNNFQNRNRIVHAGKSKWLTFPVDMKNRLHSTIMDTKLADTVDWRSRNIKVLHDAYKDSNYYNIFQSTIECIINSSDDIYTLNLRLIIYMRSYLGIETPIIYASHLGIDSHKSDLVLDICKSRGATTYISGQGGRDYLDLDKFDENNINILYEGFHEDEIYNQSSSQFIPYMSIIDLLVNNNYLEVREYIEKAFYLEK